MGLADLVYPGALHTRFHHALGAMHLMGRALDSLREKEHAISQEELEAALIAILLHDIGHGPFSHSLEKLLTPGMNHEELSLLIMQRLNKHFAGALSLALEMFTGTYHRPFFHQLISSQLDVDRLDYLNRDSFFTGVSEGTIGAERIIKLIDIVNDAIVVEEKGIYSVEHFLNARRLMYWQVYLHKTGLAADIMLSKILKRARTLLQSDHASDIHATHLGQYLAHPDPDIDAFCSLDDHDVWAAIKYWQSSRDSILAFLCYSFINRKLFKIRLTNEPTGTQNNKINQLRSKTDLSEKDLEYFYDIGSISNAAYIKTGQKIKLLKKSGEVINIENATDLPNINAMSRIVSKHYVCWAINVDL